MPTELGRDRFREISDDLPAAFRWVRDLEVTTGSGDDQLARLADRSAVLELTNHYNYARDSKDAEWMGSLWSSDGELQLGDDAGARLTGADAIAERIRGLVGTDEFTRHRVTNALVRITPSGNEAWLAAYLHLARIEESGAAQSIYGRVLGRFERQQGGWRFADWRASARLFQSYSEREGGAPAELHLDVDKPPRVLSRAQVTGKNPPVDGGRSTWHELRGDVWNAHHWLVDLATPTLEPKGKLDRLRDEAAIRDLLAGYAFAFDARDLAWTASLFSEEAVVIHQAVLFNREGSSSGTFEGEAEILGAFRRWGERASTSFLRISNPIVRFVPESREGWLMANFHLVSAEGERHSYGFGRYFGRLHKLHGAWKILDWCIAYDAELTK